MFLGFACALLAIEVIVLAVQNRQLREVLAAETAPDAPVAERNRLAIGDVFQAFTLKREDGSLATIDFDGEASTLLLVFAERCSACPMVMPLWADVVPAVPSESVRVVGLQLDPSPPTEEHVDRGFPVFTLNDVTQVPFAKLTTVPLSVILDEWGTVIWVRYGSFETQVADEIVAFLGG